MLLHIGNHLPSIPVAFSKKMKENYESIKKILTVLNYNAHNWLISADFKVISIISGLQSGYTKHCCYLCTWDSRCKENQYEQMNWPLRTERRIGQSNIKQNAFVPINKILLPPLHIKLGLAKQFIKSLKNPEAITIIGNIFSSSQ